MAHFGALATQAECQEILPGSEASWAASPWPSTVGADCLEFFPQVVVVFE